MSEEQWAEIEGFPHYLISNFGYVMNAESERLLHAYDSGDGNLKVVLYHEGGRQSFYVHQLVADAFFGDFTRGMHLSHVNGDKGNNRTNNLRLRRGREPRDRRRPGQRDSWGRKVRVVELDEVYRSVRECARHLGGDYSSIYQCLNGKRTHHLGYHYEWVDESDSAGE